MPRVNIGSEESLREAAVVASKGLSGPPFLDWSGRVCLTAERAFIDGALWAWHHYLDSEQSPEQEED